MLRHGVLFALCMWLNSVGVSPICAAPPSVGCGGCFVLKVTAVLVS